MNKILICCAALALAGCADLSKYTQSATELVGKYAPEVNEMMKKGEALTGRAQKLPASLPGVDDVKSKLAANQSQLTDLKGSLDGFPAKIDTAVKAGDATGAATLLEQQKQTSTDGVANAGKRLESLSGEVSSLETKAAARAAAPAPTPAVPATPAVPKKSVYAGKAAPNGAESQLVGFIEDGSKSVDQSPWVDLDGVSFKTGSAALDVNKSKEQLTNLAEILKAYPKVTLKVGGYTDNQGAAAANKKLSLQRASAVVTALVAMGTKAEALSAEGYGVEHPACPANDTDECRAKNRRIALHVTAK